MHGSDAFDGDYGAGSVGTLPKPVRRLLPPRPHSPSTYRDLDQVKGGVDGTDRGGRRSVELSIARWSGASKSQ